MMFAGITGLGLYLTLTSTPRNIKGENYLADLENSRQDELKMQREKSAS